LKTENTNQSTPMISVTTASSDWQQECLGLAQNGVDFVVEGVATSNTPFARKLCRRWGYRNLLIPRGILFIPAFSEFYRRERAASSGRIKMRLVRVFQRLISRRDPRIEQSNRGFPGCPDQGPAPWK
jgi:hypothetical protein